MGYEEMYDEKINLCNLIAYANKEIAIVFCYDVKDQLFEVSIHKLTDGKITHNASDIIRLHELSNDVSFEKLYNYTLHPIDEVIRNGSLEIRKYLTQISKPIRMTKEDLFHLLSYKYLIEQFIQQKLSASDFASKFWELRRADQYYFSSKMDARLAKIIDTLTLDADEFSAEGEPKGLIHIDEREFRTRTDLTLQKLNKLLQ